MKKKKEEYIELTAEDEFSWQLYLSLNRLCSALGTMDADPLDVLSAFMWVAYEIALVEAPEKSDAVELISKVLNSAIKHKTIADEE